jgi:stage II sporulation protein D
MRNWLKTSAALFLIAVFALLLLPANVDAAYTAPVSIVKIGLYNDSTKNYASANLQNVSGSGYGYELGYYNSDREFISLGAKITDTNTITMMMDRNMSYSSSSNSYSEGTSGSVVVGCYHIRLDAGYLDYASAKAVADTFTSVNAFVRYEKGTFYVLVGAYTSSSAATAAAEALEIGSEYTINSGTSYTVTVVETGTSNVLFEFDYGTTYNLAVHPLSQSDEKTITYFKGYKYYGDFVYWRNTGGNLTVINYVNVEDYVKGVIPYEMSSSWPVEALKAGAVCARTYVMANLNKHRVSGFDICNTTDCQVYRGTNSASANSNSAVEGTTGQYLTYDDALCQTYYYSCNGGASENSENVWTAKLAYLRGVEDPYEARISSNISNYNWKVTLTGDQIATKLKNKGYSCSTIVKFEITQFTEMGNVYKITFTDSNGKQFSFSKEATRTLLGLRSQRYTVNGQTVTASSNDIYVNSSTGVLSGDLESSYAVGDSGTAQLPSGSVYAITGTGTIETVDGSSSGSGVSASGKSFVINGSGYGHNVGMSQWGAYSMAKYYSKTYKDILGFYYTNSVISTSK